MPTFCPENWSAASRFVSEVGLDASPRYYQSLDAQREVFAELLALCAATPRKVLSVHCVRAFKGMFALLDAHWSAAAGSLVLHRFSGSVSDARRAVERGCFFSINPEMKESKSALRILTGLPLDRLLPETDVPFTEQAPAVPRAPGDVVDALDLTVSAKRLSRDEARSSVWRNARRIEAFCD